MTAAKSSPRRRDNGPLMPVGGAVQDVGSRRSATRIPEPEAGVTVNLQNPQPVIASVSPNPANPGSATIMIDGTGFAKGATVYFAGAALATTFVSNTLQISDIFGDCRTTTSELCRTATSFYCRINFRKWLRFERSLAVMGLCRLTRVGNGGCCDSP